MLLGMAQCPVRHDQVINFQQEAVTSTTVIEWSYIIDVLQ